MSASGARRFGGRLALVVVLSGLLLPFGSPLSGGSLDHAQAAQAVAAPIAALTASSSRHGSSWRAVRTEEFTGSSLPSGCVAYAGKYSAGDNAWSSKDVAVSGGLLKLKLEKRRTSGKAYTSGGMACLGWAQKYGRYEIRARVPVGKGIDSSFSLSPTNGTAATGIDLLAPGPETAYVSNGYGRRTENAQVVGSYSAAFHTYVIEWSPKQVRMTVDGKQIFYSNHSYQGSRWFGMVVTNGDTLTGLPDSSTTLPARFQIDSVKVSSYTGVPPKAQPSPTPTPAAGLASPSPSPTVVEPSPLAKTPAPAATNRVSALQSTPADSGSTSPALAGGIWPWLLGGSLIAAIAIFSLSYPGHRRARRQGPGTHK